MVMGYLDFGFVMFGYFGSMMAGYAQPRLLNVIGVI
jgi:hypothetical protein